MNSIRTRHINPQSEINPQQGNSTNEIIIEDDSIVINDEIKDQRSLQYEINLEKMKKQINPLKFHQSMIFDCQIDQKFEIQMNEKNISLNSHSHILALAKNNPFVIELYLFDLELHQLNLVYQSSSLLEKSFNFLQHIIFNGNSYLVFSHDQFITVFCVLKTQFWRIKSQLSKDQPFSLTTNATSIQVYYKGTKPDELKCLSITLFDNSFSLKEQTFKLDKQCQNFQQLCFCKDQCDQAYFMFLNEYRMVVYLYPNLDSDSDQPVISIESDNLLQQIHIIDIKDKRQILMDEKNQILIYENYGYQQIENTCRSLEKKNLIKYYVQLNKNTLMQLYEDQIYLSSITQLDIKPKVICSIKPFLDALYKEINSQTIIFYVEKEKNRLLQLQQFVIKNN